MKPLSTDGEKYSDQTQLGVSLPTGEKRLMTEPIAETC